MDGVNKNIQEEKEEKDMPQEETTEESSSAQAEAPKQEETQIEEKDQKPAATEDPASNAAEAEKSTEEQKEELASKGETLQGEEGSESEEGKTEEEDPSVSEDIKRAKKLLAEQDANDPARWYIVHTYSGHENKVAKSINQRVQSLGFEDRIFDIIVPTRNTIKVTQGKKDNVKEKIFPGYVLIKMILDNEAWLLVRTTQGVTSFIGSGNKPIPISSKEVEAIMRFMEEEEPLYKATFSIGEAVKIVDGPFADFLGTIDSIDEARGKLKVLVSIFGRETPVELDFLQVNKL